MKLIKFHVNGAILMYALHNINNLEIYGLQKKKIA